MSWAPQSLDNGGGFFSWSPVGSGTSNERTQAERKSAGSRSILVRPDRQPPSTYKVKAYDAEQKLLGSRFVPVKSLGLYAYDLYLDPSPTRRFSLLAIDTRRFSITEGRRRYSINVEGNA